MTRFRRPRSRYVTWDQLEDVLTPIRKEISLMATQAEADALVAQLQQDEVNIATVAQDVVDASTNIQAAIAAAEAANPNVDLSAATAELQKLSDAVAPLDAAIKALPGNTPPAGS